MGMVLVLRSYGCVWFSYKWNKWVFTPELTLPNNNESDLPLYTLSKEKDTIFFLNKFNRFVFFVDFDSQRFDQLIIITYSMPRYG